MIMTYWDNSGGRPLDITEAIGLHDYLSDCQFLMKDFPRQIYMMSSHSSINKVRGYIRDKLGPNLTTERNLFLCHHVQTIPTFWLVASCQVGIRGSDLWDKATQTDKVISTCLCHVLWYNKTMVISTNAQFYNLYILYIYRNINCRNVICWCYQSFKTGQGLRFSQWYW
jgi:hypothetical protein